MHVEVAVPVPLEKTFRYRLTDEQTRAAQVGRRVRVPFGNRHLIGYIVEKVPDDAEELDVKIKPVKEILDDGPLFGDEELELFRWISDYYLHPLGLVLKTALPSGTKGAVVKTRTEKAWVASERARDDDAVARLKKRAPKQAEVLRLVCEMGQVRSAELRERVGGSASAAARRLVEAGLLSEKIVEVRRDWAARAALDASRQPAPEPTSEQSAVLDELQRFLVGESFCPVLLHGVTGSGKTEVYLRLIREALDRGRGALVLVPEIALTPQLVTRFFSRFGEDIAVLHSGLSDGERFDAWRRIARGETQIAIGARSAVFAPVKNLGVVVVDEEHEGSYKQEDGLRYSARDVAVYRARESSAVCVLASATPSLETMHNAAEGRYRYLQLPSRIGDRPLPPVEIIGVSGRTRRADKILSEPLAAALEQNLKQGHQSLLLLNRRGYAPFVVCRDCGHTFHCPDCAVSMTYHAPRDVKKSEWARIDGRRATLRCHYCGLAQKPPERCTDCNSAELRLVGVGTQRLEDELQARLPDARIARMDRDTTARRGAHAAILRDLEEGKTDILMGTQMIAKGLDFPRVTLVGVVLADAGLNVPDFRSAERTFQLLTQVAGRAGRGQWPGRVLVQALNEDHYAVRLAARHDFKTFFATESETRSETSYPPFARLVNVRVHGAQRERVEHMARQLARFARDLSEKHLEGRVRVVGPAPAPLERVRSRWRWQMLLKSAGSADVRAVARAILEEFGRSTSDGRRIDVDVDPQSLL